MTAGLDEAREVRDEDRLEAGNIDAFLMAALKPQHRRRASAVSIYRRFALGQTTNPRFADFGRSAAYLGRRCRKLIGGSAP